MIGKIQPRAARAVPVVVPAECPACGPVAVEADLFSAADRPVAGHCPECGDIIVFDDPAS